MTIAVTYQIVMTVLKAFQIYIILVMASHCHDHHHNICYEISMCYENHHYCRDYCIVFAQLCPDMLVITTNATNAGNLPAYVLDMFTIIALIQLKSCGIECSLPKHYWVIRDMPKVETYIFISYL